MSFIVLGGNLQITAPTWVWAAVGVLFLLAVVNMLTKKGRY